MIGNNLQGLLAKKHVSANQIDLYAMLFQFDYYIIIKANESNM